VEYGKLIGGAFRVALGNWRLWPFGVFAGTGGFGFNFQYSGDFDTGGSGDGSFDPDTGLIVALALVVVALALVFLVLSVLSQGALAQSVAAIARGEQRGFRQTLRSGRATFWRMVGLYVLATLAGLGLVIIVGVLAGGPVLAVFAITDATGLRVAVVILAVLTALIGLVGLLIPFALLFQHAIREVALQGARPAGALRAGWRVLRGNPVPTLLLFLIEQGLVLAAYTGVGLISVILFVPAIVVLIATSAGPAGIVVAAVTAVVVIPAALAAAGAIGTFGHGLWTLGYLRMVAPPS
jgi:hypothetical protein